MSYSQWFAILAALVFAELTVSYVLPAGDFTARLLYVGMWAAFGAAFAMGLGDDY